MTRAVPGRPDARLLVLIGELSERLARELCAALEEAARGGVERLLLTAEQGHGLRRPAVLTALARAAIALSRRGGALVIASGERHLPEELERRGLRDSVALVRSAAEGIRLLGSLRLRPPADEPAPPRPAPTGSAPTGLAPPRPAPPGPASTGLAPPRPAPPGPASTGLASQPQTPGVPCVRFSAGPASDPTGPGCRLGGDPLLAPGTTWPRGPERPLVFVGQLDFAQLAPFTRPLRPALPQDGVLGLFYDAVEDHRLVEPGARSWFRVTWCPRTSQAAPLELEEDAPFVPPTALHPRLDESAPDDDGHQLLGLPPPAGVHDLRPALQALEGDVWTPLLRLALDGPGFPLFGTGALWLKTRDLRARCWDSAWFALRSG